MMKENAIVASALILAHPATYDKQKVTGLVPSCISPLDKLARLWQNPPRSVGATASTSEAPSFNG